MMHLSIIGIIYACVDPRCENSSNCLQGVNSLIITTKGPLCLGPHLMGFYDTYITINLTIFRMECHLLVEKPAVFN